MIEASTELTNFKRRPRTWPVKPIKLPRGDGLDNGNLCIKYKERGDEFFTSGNYIESIDNYQKLFSITDSQTEEQNLELPENILGVESYRQMAYSLYKYGLIEESLEYCVRGLRKGSDEWKLFTWIKAGCMA